MSSNTIMCKFVDCRKTVEMSACLRASEHVLWQKLHATSNMDISRPCSRQQCQKRPLGTHTCSHQRAHVVSGGHRFVPIAGGIPAGRVWGFLRGWGGDSWQSSRQSWSRQWAVPRLVEASILVLLRKSHWRNYECMCKRHVRVHMRLLGIMSAWAGCDTYTGRLTSTLGASTPDQQRLERDRPSRSQVRRKARLDDQSRPRDVQRCSGAFQDNNDVLS